MAKASGVAASFGVSIDSLIGDITSIASVTFESGSIIGRALKTIYSRITTMDDAEKILNSVGIGIKNLAGDNREVADIISDLRGKWDSLSNAQQQNIAVTLAGRDQLTRFIAMMSSADIAISATETSLNSQGSAIRENEKYLKSMGAQINMLKSSFTELSVSVGENGLGQSFMAIVKTLTFMANGFAKFTETTKGLNIILPLLALGVYGAVRAFTALRVAATGAKLSLGWIGLGILAFEGLATAGFGAGVALGETSDKLVKSASGYTQTADKLDQLVAKYDELKPKAETSTKAQNELKGVLDEINRVAPSVIENTDKYGKSMELNKEKADAYAASLRTMSDEQLGNATLQINSDYSQAKNDLDNLKVKESEAKKGISELYSFMIDYQKKYDVTSMVEASAEYTARTAKLSGKALRDAANEFGDYNKIMSLHKFEIKEYGDLLEKIENKQAEVDGLETRRKQIDFLTTDYKKLAETVKVTFDGKINSNVFGDFDKSQLTALIEFGNQIKKTKGNIENYTHILTKAKLSQEQIEAVIKALTDANQLNGEAWEETADLIGENKEQVDELVKAYENATSAISSLNGIMNELNDKQGVSAQSIQLLMEKYPELLQYLNDEKTLRIKLQEEIDKEAAVARQAMIEKMSNVTSFYNAMLANNTTMVNKFATDYGIDLKNFTSLASAKAKVDNEVRTRMSNAWNNYYNDLMKKANGTISISVDGKAPLAVKIGYGSEGAKGTPYYDDFTDAAKISTDFTKIINDYVGTITPNLPKIGLDTDDKKKKDAKSSRDRSSSRKDAPVSQYISSEFKKNQETYNDQLDESEHKVSKLKESTEAYRKELAKQIPIIKNLMTVNDKEGTRLTKRNAQIDSIIKGVMKGRKFDDLNNDEKKLVNDLTKEKDENSSTIKSLIGNNRDLADSIIDVNKSIADSKLAELTEKQEKAAKKNEQIMKNYAATQAKFDKQLIDSKRRQSYFEVGSDKWEAELKLQNEIHKKKMDFILKEREELKKSLRTDNLSAQEKENLKKRIDELSIAYGDLTDQIRDNNQSIRDAMAETMTKQKEQHIEALRKKYEALHTTLKELFKDKDLFDFGAFTDNFDEILYELDKLDGILKKNVSALDSTTSSRADLTKLKNDIQKVAVEIKKMREVTSESDAELEQLIRNQISYANGLFDQIATIENSIRDQALAHKQVEDALQKEIELKNEQLRLLDEQYEKEDRNKRLKEVGDEITSVMNDKRFEIINENGEKVLTYDTAKLSELQKQKDDMLQQFQRDDIKKAMQDEISRMEDKLGRTKQIHAVELSTLELQKNSLQSLYDTIVKNTDEKLTKLGEIQNKSVEDTEKKWDETISAVEKGTTTFDELMNGWYGTATKNLATFATGVEEQIQRIKNAYASLSNLSITTTSSVKTAVSSGSSAVKGQLEQYHVGGVVGGEGKTSRLTELANKLFNTKPNEQVIKSLKGELQVPPKNIPNLFTNIGNTINSLLPKQNMLQPVGDTIILQGVTIKADNPKQFFNDLDIYIRMNKS